MARRRRKDLRKACEFGDFVVAASLIFRWRTHEIVATFRVYFDQPEILRNRNQVHKTKEPTLSSIDLLATKYSLLQLLPLFGASHVHRLQLSQLLVAEQCCLDTACKIIVCAERRSASKISKI